MSTSSRSIPCLDGLRAISILAVIAAHAVGTREFPHRTTVLGLGVGELGDLGVRVFFVISGYLITHLLVTELAATGTVSLRRFYFRRALRIFPAFYVFLAVVVVALALGWLADPESNGTRSLVQAGTYTTNYFDPIWYVAHSWSLSVEEQFYLLWPAIFLWRGPETAAKAALAAVILFPLFRMLYIHLAPDTPHWDHHFETTGNAIACGCLLALWSSGLDTPWRAQLRRIARSRWAVLSVAIVALGFLAAPRPNAGPFYLFADSLMNVGIAWAVAWCLAHADGKLGSVLNWRPLAFIGVLSYSIYLWQQPFLEPAAGPIRGWLGFPLNLLPIFPLAALSYYLVERPVLRLRQRWERRVFAGAR